MTWREKYMRDPELADSIIKALRDDLKESEKRAKMLTFALERIAEGGGCRECGGEIQAQIAKEALE
jgi:RNA polymerase-binding transcription factor DksA